MPLCDEGCHMGGNVVLGIRNGSQRVHLDGGSGQGVHTSGPHGAYLAVGERVVGRELEPVLDLVVSVERVGETLVGVLVAYNRTIVVEV